MAILGFSLGMAIVIRKDRISGLAETVSLQSIYHKRLHEVQSLESGAKIHNKCIATKGCAYVPCRNCKNDRRAQKYGEP